MSKKLKNIILICLIISVVMAILTVGYAKTNLTNENTTNINGIYTILLTNLSIFS